MDLWGSFVGRADMYMKDGLHLSGKGGGSIRGQIFSSSR